AHADGDHHLAAEALLACLVGVVEVAHALGAVHPGAQVVGVGILAGGGGHELARRPLGVLRRAQVDLGRPAGHFGVALFAGIQWCIGLRLLRGGTHLWLRLCLFAVAAADHPRLWRWHRGGAACLLRQRGHAFARARDKAGLWFTRALGLLVLGAPHLVGGGQEVGLIGGERGAGLAED